MDEIYSSGVLSNKYSRGCNYYTTYTATLSTPSCKSHPGRGFTHSNRLRVRKRNIRYYEIYTSDKSISISRGATCTINRFFGSCTPIRGGPHSFAIRLPVRRTHIHNIIDIPTVLGVQLNARGKARRVHAARRNTVAGDDGVDILSPQVALTHTHTHPYTIQRRRTCCSQTAPEPL